MTDYIDPPDIPDPVFGRAVVELEDESPSPDGYRIIREPWDSTRLRQRMGAVARYGAEVATTKTAVFERTRRRWAGNQVVRIPEGRELAEVAEVVASVVWEPDHENPGHLMLRNVGIKSISVTQWGETVAHVLPPGTAARIGPVNR